MKAAVIMCVYRRIPRLAVTLDMLNAQTWRHFELFIWNNSGKILSIKDGLNFRVTVIDSAVNVGGFGRFYAARTIYEDFDKMVFIDDDQIFDGQMLQTLVGESRPQSVCAWWSWNFREKYFARSRCGPGESAMYCGTGGMIIDASVFADDRLFDCPSKFWFIEDLWLSYFVSHNYRWPLYASGVDIQIIDDGKDQFRKLKALKNDFLAYLRDTGRWRI